MSELAAGFDIGGTNIRGVAVREDGEIVAQVRQSRPASSDGMIDAVIELLDDLEKETGDIGKLGVGCAGCVDTDGVVLTSPNIPELVKFPLRATLIERSGRHVVTGNDATTATVAEARTGAGAGYDDIVFVAFGTGIGGGFVIDGEIRHGASGLAGEIGHMIINPQGPSCVCGRSGCWEQMASGTALGRMARTAAEAGRAPTILVEAGGEVADIRGEHVARLLAKGDPVAEKLMSEMAQWIAIGLNNLVVAVDPALIIIGGGLSDMGDPFFEPTRRSFADVMVDRRRRPDIPIVGASHGGLAGALGAALLAFD